MSPLAGDHYCYVPICDAELLFEYFVFCCFVLYLFVLFPCFPVLSLSSTFTVAGGVQIGRLACQSFGTS